MGKNAWQVDGDEEEQRRVGSDYANFDSFFGFGEVFAFIVIQWTHHSTKYRKEFWIVGGKFINYGIVNISRNFNPLLKLSQKNTKYLPDPHAAQVSSSLHFQPYIFVTWNPVECLVKALSPSHKWSEGKGRQFSCTHSLHSPYVCRLIRVLFVDFSSS